MAKYSWLAGTTDRTILVFVQDSSSTTGDGLASLAAADFTARYIRVETDNDVTIATLSLSDLSALTDAHTDGGIFPVDNTNAPGWYRLDIPDAVLAAGAWSAGISLIDAGSNDIAQVALEIQLDPAPVNLTQISGDAQSATDLKDFADSGYDPSSNKVTGVVLVDTCTTNTDMLTAAAVKTGLDIGTSGGVAGHTTLAGVATAVTTLDGKVDTIDSEIGTIDGIVDDILADTAEIGTAGAGLTAVPWNASWDAEVQSEVTDALNAYDPPTNTEMAAAFTEIKGATFNGTTDSLEALRNRGDAAWVTSTFSITAGAIADAVWDEAISGHSDSGSTGEALAAAGSAGDPWTTALPGAYSAGQAGYIIGTNVDATVSSRASQSSLNTVDGIVDDILLDTAEIANLNDLSASDVRDAVGLASADLDTQLAALPTAAEIVTAVEAGELANIGDDVDTLTTNVAAILADTDALQVDWADGGRLDLIVDSILADTGTDGVVLSAATCNKIADHARRRTQANVEASSDGDTLSLGSLYGFIQQAQESNTTDNAGKLTTYQTDGSTELGQKTLTTDDTAEPITGIE